MTTYVNLGKSGLKVSRIALGTMTYGDRNNYLCERWLCGCRARI
ncbi:hypothetical protein [Nostoc sp. 2RC]|nr:hypothetical protein [Nostoc sp. 2RC]